MTVCDLPAFDHSVSAQTARIDERRVRIRDLFDAVRWGKLAFGVARRHVGARAR